MDIERTAGFITRVGDTVVKDPGFPDWTLYCIEFPEGEKTKYLQTLRKSRVNIRRVCPTRIYFED